MSVDVGSAVGYLDLDVSGFLEGLRSAQSEANQVSDNIATQLGKKSSAIGEKLTSAGSTLTKTVTTPIVGLGTAAVTVTANFESAMSKVSAISGAVGDDFDALSDKAREMGASTKFSASEAAEAFQYMAMAGWKTEDMLGGIEGVLDLAAASGESLATTSDIVTDALTAFGLTANDTAHFADVLAAASSNANTNVSMMGETFKYAAPIAGALGYSIEDTAEAIGLLANSGIKGSQAGTTLRTIMNKLSGEVTICGEALGEFTVQTTNSDGSMRDFNDILDDCRVAFSQLSESEQASAASALVGQEAMSGFLALMNAAPSDIEKLRGAIADADGTAKDMAATMQDNLTGQLTILKSSLEELAISFGELLLPVIKDVVAGVQDLIAWLNGLDEGQKKTIATIATIAAVVGPVLLVLGKLATGFGKIATVVGTVGGKLGMFASAASSTAAPAQAAAGGVGGLAKSAMNLLAAGAGILMAAGGLALLAQSAIALSEAGWPAIACMGGLVAALVGLAAGAAAVAPALTAGSVGLVAFGGALALVGVGVLAATAGVALLATQLPTIAQYGSQAAGALIELGVGLTTLGGGAIVAGAGLTIAGAGLTVVAVGAAAAAVGVTALGVGVLALAAGAITLGAGLTLCGAGLTLMAATGQTAAAGMSSLAVAATAAFVPIVAGAASSAVLTAALLALAVPLAALTVEFGASAVACGLLAVAMESTAGSVTTIESSAASAADSLAQMVTAVDVVKAGLDGFEALATAAVNGFVNAFVAGGPTASAAALALATGVTTNVQTGLAPMPNVVTMTMTQVNTITTAGMTQMSMTVITHSNMSTMAVQMCMTQINVATTAGMAQMNTTIRSGFSSAVSYIKSLAGQSYSWGADIMQGLINGINSKMGALRSAVNNAANIIYSNLHFSRPDEGPLRDYETWMPDFMEGLAKGINANLYQIEGAVGNVTDRMTIEPKQIEGGMFTTSDTANLKSYNLTLVNTIGLYKQLVEQMRLYSQYSAGIAPVDNGLLKTERTSVDMHTEDANENKNDKDSSGKPDQLVIPITIGEEQLETVVVDLLRREVRI